MKQNLPRGLAILFALLLSISVSPAQVLTNLATWSFLGEPGDQISTPVADFATGVFATSITRGSNIVPIAATNTMNSTNWGTNSAFYPNRYYEFGISNNPGFTLSLTSLVVGMARNANGPTNYAIRSSLDSFGSVLFSGVVPTSATKITNIFGAGFTNLSSPITFRIYANNSVTLDGRFRLTGSPISSDAEALLITGTAVPEPTTNALIVMSLAGLIALQRLRKKS